MSSSLVQLQQRGVLGDLADHGLADLLAGRGVAADVTLPGLDDVGGDLEGVGGQVQHDQRRVHPVPEVKQVLLGPLLPDLLHLVPEHT